MGQMEVHRKSRFSYMYMYVILCSARVIFIAPALSPKTSLRAGGTHLSVLARSIASYLHVSLDNKEVDRVSRVLSQHTTRWVMEMMK